MCILCTHKVYRQKVQTESVFRVFTNNYTCVILTNGQLTLSLRTPLDLLPGVGHVYYIIGGLLL